ncbi:Fe-S cluster assembly sulfur transfer protein SufU [Acidocella sp.]|uniref:Fe-S cluster assembly sulfur transfer protein SufU n=1 Tax=Acidocella sp. TaxID=50710 RepID=UPI0026076D9E|nr:SUF system NifU family Fe-S cluster assembly protein [Acidocella sp.]
MTGLYQDIVLNRTRHPLHAGKPVRFEAQATASSPICGDRVRVYLSPAGMDVHHEAEGCAIMAASADLMASAVLGKNPEMVREISKNFTRVVTTGEADPSLGELNALAGVSEFPSRIGCATLPWRALEEALANV